MSQSILIIGHADADGHLIAEQIRRNLELIDGFHVDVVVDPAITRDHKAWKKLGEIQEVEKANIIFFVDLMFAPMSFADEARALVDFTKERPTKRFFLIDHHPLPVRRLSSADNLRSIYRPSVFDCTIGPRSGMMVVAALCENQDSRVSDIKEPIHDRLAKAMRRAAALGGPLPGEKLLALLKFDCWRPLEQLGTEDSAHHRLPRGRRAAGQSESNELRALNETATRLLKAPHGLRQISVGPFSKEPDMSYDVAEERYPYDEVKQVRRRNTASPSKDLEAIVTLLELAALSLTTHPGQTFTFARLMDEARTFGGEEIPLEDEDAKIVLDKATFIERIGKELRLK